MGRRDVIEVPKVHRPPDPMAVPRRPNVWTFHTAVPPDQIAARLEPTIGADIGPGGSQPVVGDVAATGAEIHRRPTRNSNVKFPMTLNWAAQGEGSLVTCRMRLPFGYVLFIGAWAVTALASLGEVPGALMALTTELGRVRYRVAVSDVVEPFVLAAIAYGLFWGARKFSERHRVFLMAHVTRVLEAGPVRESREGPQGGPLSPFWNDTATTRS